MGKNMRFAGGLVLGFGFVVLVGLVVFGSTRRPSRPEELAKPASPSIRLICPGSDAVFQAPADILMEAEVEQANGPVRVEFYHGPIRIGEAWTAPYRCVWKGIRYPGSYQLTAKLLGPAGPEVESPQVWVTVERETSSVESIAAPPVQR